MRFFLFPSTAPFWNWHFHFFFLQAQKITTTTRWKRDTLSSSLTPSSQIDGPCNWQPLCAIARINRHWCRQAKTVSGAQGVADMVELMVHHIYRQNTINVSAERSGRLWVARRVLLILRMLLSDGVSRFDVWCYKLWVIRTNGIFFFSFLVSKRLFVWALCSSMKKKKVFAIRRGRFAPVSLKSNERCHFGSSPVQRCGRWQRDGEHEDDAGVVQYEATLLWESMPH